MMIKRSIFVLLGAALLCGCARPEKPPEEYGKIHIDETQEERNESFTEILPESARKETATLSETEIADRETSEGYKWVPVSSMEISFVCPDSFDVCFEEDKDIVIKDEGSTYYLYCFPLHSFRNASDISCSAEAVIKRKAYEYQGNRCVLALFDSLGKEIRTGSKGFEIASEVPYAVFTKEGGMNIYEPVMAVSYYLYREKAFLIYGFTESEAAPELIDAEVAILDSICDYLPSWDAEALSFTKDTFLGNGIKIKVPEDWKETIKSGFICYQASLESVHAGTTLLLFTDEKGRYASDPLSLPAGIKKKQGSILLGLPEDAFDIRRTVTDFRELTINGIKGYFFEMADEILPLSNEASEMLTVKGKELRTLCVSFSDLTGNPCIISVTSLSGGKYMDTFFTELEDTITYTR